MRFRKLRIAWSVAWGVVAALMIGLCIRSYQQSELLQPWSQTIVLSDGSLYFDESSPTAPLRFFRFDNTEADGTRSRVVFAANLSRSVALSDAMVIAVILATVPWIGGLRWRFSLRMLLIATTLIAVVLGMIVWMSRVG